MMIQIVTKFNIEDILDNPGDYFDDEGEICLLKVYGKDVEHPVELCFGMNCEEFAEQCDSDGPFYFKRSNGDAEAYTFCTLEERYETYAKILNVIMRESEQ